MAQTFVDGTPVLSSDGTENFPGFRWEFRPGSQAQEYIQGIPAVENEISVGSELKSGTPWVRSVSNLQLSAVRLRLGWPMLQKQADNGDVNGYRIEYAIDVATDGGSYQEVLTAAIDDKPPRCMNARTASICRRPPRDGSCACAG